MRQHRFEGNMRLDAESCGDACLDMHFSFFVAMAQTSGCHQTDLNQIYWNHLGMFRSKALVVDSSVVLVPSDPNARFVARALIEQTPLPGFRHWAFGFLLCSFLSHASWP